MLWNEKTRDAVLLPPRVASRSLSAALEPLGFTSINGRHEWDDAYLEEARRIFCPVRHPTDTLVSWWAWLRHQERPDASQLTFGQWLRDWLLCRDIKSGANPMIDLEEGSLFLRWTRRAAIIWRFEALQHCLTTANFHATLPHIKDSEVRGPWTLEADLEDRILVAKTFAHDFVVYGYQA